jgi:hypothetical protein
MQSDQLNSENEAILIMMQLSGFLQGVELIGDKPAYLINNNCHRVACGLEPIYENGAPSAYVMLDFLTAKQFFIDWAKANGTN